MHLFVQVAAAEGAVVLSPARRLPQGVSLRGSADRTQLPSPAAGPRAGRAWVGDAWCRCLSWGQGTLTTAEEHECI